MSVAINKVDHSLDSRGQDFIAWGGIVVSLLLVVALFWSTGVKLVHAWLTDPNYKHGFFVLPLSLFFAWIYLRSNPPATDHSDTWRGWQGIVAGGILHLVCAVFEWVMLDFVALALILRGLAILAGGKAWSRGLLFPIFFLFFMFPLPYYFTNLASLWLQQAVTVSTGLILDGLVGCVQRGNELQMSGMAEPLKVGQECSGVRQLVAFLALGCVIAWCSRRGWRTKIALVLMAAPIAIVTNIVRVLMMAFGARWFAVNWSNPDVHDIPAMITMPLGLLLYFALLRIMDPPAKMPPVEVKGAA